MSLVVTNNQNFQDTARFWIEMFKSKKAPQLSPIVHGRCSTIQPEVELNQSFVSTALNLREEQSLMKLDKSVVPQVVGRGYSSHSLFSPIGKIIYCKSENGYAKPYEGTAFLAHIKGRVRIVTAGHCLFSDRMINAPRQWSQHLVFIPGYDGSHSVLQSLLNGDYSIAQKTCVNTPWVESGLDTRYEFDWGFIDVVEPVNELVERFGAFGVHVGDDGFDDYRRFFSVGYTGGEEFSNGAMWVTEVPVSRQLSVDQQPHLRMFGNKFENGASGGPVVAVKEGAKHPVVLGLNAAFSTYTNDYKYWDSPRFGDCFYDVFVNN